MKMLLRAVFLNSLILYLAILIYPGMAFDGTLKTLVMAAVALTLLNKIVTPIIKLLLLPINILTLGIFGWVANVLTMFILTRLVSGFVVRAYDFPGILAGGFAAPPFHFSILWSLVIASMVISLTGGVIHWLLRK